MIWIPIIECAISFALVFGIAIHCVVVSIKDKGQVQR